MRGRDRRRYEMLTRVRTFGATHGQLFPTTSPAHDAFGAVAGEIDHLIALDVAERSASQASRAARKAAARQVLAGTLIRAGLTACVLARTNAQLDARIPPRLPTDDQLLLTLARQFASRAAPYAAQFAVHGVPIAEIEAAVNAFEEALQQRGIGHDGRVKARAERESAFARAIDAVAMLDVAVVNYLGNDPGALAVWKHDRKIGQPRRTGTAASEPAPEAGSGQLSPAGGEVTAAA